MDLESKVLGSSKDSQVQWKGSLLQLPFWSVVYQEIFVIDKNDAQKTITNFGTTLGSMLVTKFIYEEDGKDTTRIDEEIKKIEYLLKRTIKLYRMTHNVQESKTQTEVEET